MSERKSHAGGCHCGAVRYNVEGDLSEVIACNCSMCQKKGTLLAFVPAESFVLQAGDDHLSTYTFNKHIIQHLFCSKCGVTSFARGKDPSGREMVAVNVRCLDDVDLDAVTITKIDGRSF
jgi:hypothetical protein